MIRPRCFVVSTVAACALLIAGSLAAQQPLGAAVDSGERLFPVPSPAVAVEQAVAPQRVARVQRVDVQQDGAALTVSVPIPAGAAWTISEPYFIDDHVRLHLEISVPRVPRVLLPQPTGVLLGISVTEPAARTGLMLDIVEGTTYDARLDDGRVVIHLAPGVTPVLQASAVEAAAPVEAAIVTAETAAVMSRLDAHIATARRYARTAGVVIRDRAAWAAAVLADPSHRVAVAGGLGLLLTLLLGLAVRAAVRRPAAPRSIVLGMPARPTTEPAWAALPPAASPAPTPVPARAHVAAPPVKPAVLAATRAYGAPAVRPAQPPVAAAPAPVVAPASVVPPAPVVTLAPVVAPTPVVASPPAAVVAPSQDTARRMAEAGLSQAQIAARMRVSRDAVSLLLAMSRNRPDDAAATGRKFPAGRLRNRLRLFGRKR